MSEWKTLKLDNEPLDIFTWEIGKTHEVQIKDDDGEWKYTAFTEIIRVLNLFDTGSEYRYRPIPQPKSKEELAFEYSDNCGEQLAFRAGWDACEARMKEGEK